MTTRMRGRLQPFAFDEHRVDGEITTHVFWAKGWKEARRMADAWEVRVGGKLKEGRDAKRHTV